MTSAERMFLRPSVKIEPLLCRWPAWPHLIAPACHAMNLTLRHLPHLRSFVATPSVHIAASADPKLFGGPFVNLKTTDVARAKSLIEETTRQCAHLIAFAEAFRGLDAKLQDGAKGHCLNSYNGSLQHPLAGLVEVTYDLRHNARVKVREEFVYDSALGNRECQEVCLHEVRDAAREFFMSTPVLEGPGRMFLKLPFDSPIIDELAALRTRPGDLEETRGRLVHAGVEADPEAFFALFTNNCPTRRTPAYPGDDVRVRYFGHACVLVQTANVSVLLDPVTAWERDDQLATLTFDDLPDFIDYVVITHCHQDHLVAETLVQLRRRVGQVIVPHNDWGNLADPSMKLILTSLGFSNILIVDPFDSVAIPDGEILSLPFSGEHADLDINSKQCVAIRLKGRQLVFLVDSDGIDPMSYRYLAQRLGRVDALFLGMECRGAPLTWLYGSLLGRAISRKDDESRRLSGSDCERALRILEEIGCDRLFVYAMGQEPWMRHLMGLEYSPDAVQIVESDKLVEHCRSSGIQAERLKGCREMIF